MMFCKKILFFTIFFPLIICQADDHINASISFDSEEEKEFISSQLPDAEYINLRYDYIIVGAGSAGSVMANRLSEISSSSILLIEAGGHETLEMLIPGNAPNFMNSYVDWNYEMETCEKCAFGASKKQKLHYALGKVLGGCSAINYMAYNRGNPAIYDEWENKYQNPGWSFQNIEKYFKKLESYHIYDPSNTNYFGKNGPQHVELAKFHTRMVEPVLTASEEFGLPILNINGFHQIGSSLIQSTAGNGTRFSTNRAYLTPIKNRNNLDLKLNCQVTKIIMRKVYSKLKAEGVKFSCQNGQNFTVFARKEVILSAGAINSPRLLMLSGIGPKDHLDELKIEVLQDLPVGNNYMEHPGVVGFQFLVDEPLYSSSNMEELYLYNRTGPLELVVMSEIMSFLQPIKGSQSIELIYDAAAVPAGEMNDEIYDKVYRPYARQPSFNIVPLLLRPQSRGFIRLANVDPFSKPIITPNYLSEMEDVSLLIKGVKNLISITKQPALAKLGTRMVNTSLPNCAHYEFLSDEYIECHIRTLTIILFHACGTCKMGPKGDPTAVVDHELRVHGVSNLRVVDGSIMPEIVSGHTNGPIIMIAEKAADMVKQASR